MLPRESEFIAGNGPWMEPVFDFSLTPEQQQILQDLSAMFPEPPGGQTPPRELVDPADAFVPPPAEPGTNIPTGPGPQPPPPPSPPPPEFGPEPLLPRTSPQESLFLSMRPTEREMWSARHAGGGGFFGSAVGGGRFPSGSVSLREIPQPESFAPGAVNPHAVFQAVLASSPLGLQDTGAIASSPAFQAIQQLVASGGPMSRLVATLNRLAYARSAPYRREAPSRNISVSLYRPADFGRRFQSSFQPVIGQ